MEDRDSRTEEPTAKRKSEARKKGQVAKSADLSSALTLLAGILIIWLLSSYMGNKILGMMKEIFLSLATFEANENNIVYYTRAGSLFFVVLTGPVLICIAIIGVLSNVTQFGLMWSNELYTPKFGKVFSIEGFKKLVSKSKIIDLIKNIAKMIAVGIVAYLVIAKHYPVLLSLADQSLANANHFILSIILELVIKCCLLLLIIGILDFMYQKWKTHEDMKMTKQEVKDEAKMSDGDPKIKNKLRQLRIKMHQQFMMNEVPKATVVVTNPTFIAIAIRYQVGVDASPVVVAKGKRLIAERIRDLAKENGVPLVENKPLARGLYDIIEVGDRIPEEFYAPVAEILAYVYQMQKKNPYEMAHS